MKPRRIQFAAVVSKNEKSGHQLLNSRPCRLEFHEKFLMLYIDFVYSRNPNDYNDDLVVVGGEPEKKTLYDYERLVIFKSFIQSVSCWYSNADKMYAITFGAHQTTDLHFESKTEAEIVYDEILDWLNYKAPVVEEKSELCQKQLSPIQKLLAWVQAVVKNALKDFNVKNSKIS